MKSSLITFLLLLGNSNALKSTNDKPKLPLKKDHSQEKPGPSELFLSAGEFLKTLSEQTPTSLIIKNTALAACGFFAYPVFFGGSIEMKKMPSIKTELCTIKIKDPSVSSFYRQEEIDVFYARYLNAETQVERKTIIEEFATHRYLSSKQPRCNDAQLCSKLSCPGDTPMSEFEELVNEGLDSVDISFKGPL
jgi:hypothetical protein